MGLALKQFLADLSLNAGRLGDFLRDPETVMSRSSLSPRERSALMNGDERAIRLSAIEDDSDLFTRLRIKRPDAAGSTRLPDSGRRLKANAGASQRLGQLIVVGTGIRITGQLTIEAIAAIQMADKVLHNVGDPVAEQVLRNLNARSLESLTTLYAEEKDRRATYEEMIDRIVACVKDGLSTCVVFFGHPGVCADAPLEAMRRLRMDGHSVRMLAAVSAEDCLFADLGFDPNETGCQSYEASRFLAGNSTIDPSAALVLRMVGFVGVAAWAAGGRDHPDRGRIVERLSKHYPPDHEVIIYEAPSYVRCEPRIVGCPLLKLAAMPMSDLSTLFVPPVVRQ